MFFYRGGSADSLDASFDELSSGALFDRARRCAGFLKASGVTPGDYCLVAGADNQTTLAVFFAAVLLGAYPAIQPEAPAMRGGDKLLARLTDWRKRLGPNTWALVEPGPDAPAVTPVPGAKGTLTITGDLLTEGTPLTLDAIHPAGEDDIAFVQITSGSTGAG